jgi:hypothetical protein
MKNLVITLMVFCPLYSLYAQNPYLLLSYDSIVIYDFDWRDPITKKIVSIIDTENRALASTVKKSACLDKKTAMQLSRLLGEKTSYGQEVASCFEPHLGIVFYQQGKHTAHIDVCLTCNRLESSLKIPAQDQGKHQTEDDVYYTLYGMSKSFRKYLNRILVKNKFSHQVAPGSMFD